jgi:toxin ParE1/3/4
MGKKYAVEWAEVAENDLLKIIEYIAQRSPKNALKILRKIKKQVSELAHNPNRCRIVPELKEHGINQYREMIIPPWRVIFRVMSSSVHVISVIDSRRDIEDVLLIRLSGSHF